MCVCEASVLFSLQREPTNICKATNDFFTFKVITIKLRVFIQERKSNDGNVRWNKLKAFVSVLFFSIGRAYFGTSVGTRFQVNAAERNVERTKVLIFTRYPSSICLFSLHHLVSVRILQVSFTLFNKNSNVNFFLHNFPSWRLQRKTKIIFYSKKKKNDFSSFSYFLLCRILGILLLGSLFIKKKN